MAVNQLAQLGPLDAIAYVQEQGEMGRARGQRNQLAQLASQSYSATPEQQNSLLSQMAAINPQAAQAQQAQFQSTEDRRNRTLANMANLLVNVPEQARPALYQKMLPSLQSFGIEAPAAYDATSAPVIDQTARELYQAYNGGRAGDNTPAAIRELQILQQNPELAALDMQRRQSRGWELVNIPDGQGGTIQRERNPYTGEFRAPDYSGSQQLQRMQGANGAYNVSADLTPEQLALAQADMASGSQLTEAQFPARDVSPAQFNSGGLGYTPPKPELTAYQLQSLGFQQASAARADEAAARAAQAAENSSRVATAQGETSMRKEVSDQVKSDRSILGMYQNVQSAAANPSAAGDLSMIFAYMKMLDPGSVVREQEFANAQNAAGVPDQVRNAWNKALSGQRLNANQRQDFINQAGRLATAASQRITNTARKYQDIARDYGYDAQRATGLADLSGVNGRVLPNGAQASEVSQQAIDYLRQNPQLRQQFEQKYGVSADQFLR